MMSTQYRHHPLVSQQHYYYKSISLILLTIQQASMPLMVRYTRVRTDQRVFIATVNVFTMELIKIVTCSLILVFVVERSLSRCDDRIFDWNIDCILVFSQCLRRRFAMIQSRQSRFVYRRWSIHCKIISTISRCHILMRQHFVWVDWIKNKDRVVMFTYARKVLAEYNWR